MAKVNWAALAATAVLVLVAGPALADSAVLNKTCAFLSQLAQWLVGVGYVSGAIGIAFVSIKASAAGRFSFAGFSGLLGGMFVLGAIPAIVSYLISGSFSWTC